MTDSFKMSDSLCPFHTTEFILSRRPTQPRYCQDLVGLKSEFQSDRLILRAHVHNRLAALNPLSAETSPCASAERILRLMPTMSSSDEEKFDSEDHSSDDSLEWKLRVRAQLEAEGIYYTRNMADRRPLIDRVTNKWRDEPEDDEDYYYSEKPAIYQHQDNARFRSARIFLERLEQKIVDVFDLDNDASCMNVTYDVIVSPRFRRVLLGIIAAIILTILYYTRSVGPFLRAEWIYKEGFVEQKTGTFGVAKGGEFKHSNLRIAHLNDDLVPGGAEDPTGDRRLIFVGDIHGCLEELKALQEKVGFREGKDTLVAVGDTITKGPDNLGVLDELIRINAISIRGNHEDRLLEAERSFKILSGETPTALSSSNGFSKDIALLKSLQKHHLRYLHSMPLILRIPALPSAKSEHREAILNEILVVHAGLVPRLELRKQDPYYVMNMRSIHLKTHAPSATRSGKSGKNKPWTELWNWYNERLYRGRSLIGFKPLDDDESENVEMRQHALPDGNRFSELWSEISGGKPRPSPQVVVYGHDSKVGLHIDTWSKGLDSACVKGGKLTAMVLNANGDTKLESVDCKSYW